MTYDQLGFSKVIQADCISDYTSKPSNQLNCWIIYDVPPFSRPIISRMLVADSRLNRRFSSKNKAILNVLVDSLCRGTFFFFGFVVVFFVLFFWHIHKDALSLK